MFVPNGIARLRNRWKHREPTVQFSLFLSSCRSLFCQPNFLCSLFHTHFIHARTTHTLTDRPDSSHHLKHAPLLFPCLLLDLNHYIISLSLSLSTSRTTSCPCVLLLPLCLLPQIGFYFHSCSVLLTYFLCSLASPTFIYALITTINTTIIICGTITHYAFILLSSLLLGLVSSLSLFINPSSLITADFVFRHFTILLSLSLYLTC